MNMHKRLFHAVALLTVSVVSNSLFAQGGITEMKQGRGGTAAQGAAGTEGSQGDTGLEHCDAPLGAIAVVEPQDYVSAALSNYGLSSPVGIIRMMIQQSNCFIVVERGQGMQNMMQERALAGGGELREASNVGGGQMVAADFILTPAVVFSENNAGGVGGAVGGVVGGLFGNGGRAIAALAGGLKFKEAQTSMLISDARSGVQVTAAEGSARKADLSLGGVLFGGGAAGAAGGYGNTNEGKVIAASLVDNYNQVVTVVRNNPNLQRNIGSLSEEALSGGSTQAGSVYNEGDILYPKIDNVKLMGTPAETGEVVSTLSKTMEIIYMGTEENGFLGVESSEGGGWVKKILVTK